MKKTLIAVLSVAVALFLLVGATYSWFYAADDKPDEFSITHFNVRLNEVFDGWRQKEICASNIGDMPALARLAAVPIITAKDGTRLDTHIGNSAVVSLVRPGDFAANWMPGSDGWYYYRHVLEKGDETTLFMTQVEFAAGFDFNLHPEYIDAVLDVDVMLGSAPVFPPDAFLKVWDLARDGAVEAMLQGICAPYYA